MSGDLNSPTKRRVLSVYAVLAVLVAIGIPLCVSAGTSSEPEPEIAGGYRLAQADPCLGRSFDLLQSGVFVNLEAEASRPSGALRAEDGRLSGTVSCLAGGEEPIGATRMADVLRGSIGTRGFEAQAGPEPEVSRAPAPTSIAGEYELVPAPDCLGGELELEGGSELVAVLVDERSVGELAYSAGEIEGSVECGSGQRVPVSGEAAGRELDLLIGEQRVRAEKMREFGETLAVFFIAITVVMLAARAVGWAVARMGFPRVMGEVLAGIMLGPTLLGAISPQLQATLFPTDIIPALGLVANLGLVFYMFMIGLELDPALLRGRVGQAAAISNASVALPLVLGFGLAVVLFPLVAPEIDFLPFALFIGVAMSITAFPVLARILVERRMLKAPAGAISMASAAIDDVTAWFLIALATAVAVAGSGIEVVETIGLAVAFCAVMFLAVRPVLARMSIAYAELGRVPGGWLVAIFAGILLSAYATETIGIALIFGAFVMGLVMPRNAGLTEDVTGRFEDFVVILLLPLFFVYTGLRTDVGLLDRPELWWMTLGIIAVAIVGTLAGATLAARVTGFDWRGAAAIGALMNTRGLTELIVLNLALEAGVITSALFASLVIMALVTTFMAGPLLNLIDPDFTLSVPVEDELVAARTESESRFPALTIPDRSIIVAPMSDTGLVQLLAIAEPLAQAEPRRELILTRPISPPRGARSGARGGLQTENLLLREEGELLREARDDLIERGTAARAAAFISTASGTDLCRFAEDDGVDLLLTDGRRPLLGGGVPQGEIGGVLHRAPCDVAVLVAREDVRLLAGDDEAPVLVPFGGAEHDWAALELGAWLASATGHPLQLLGTVSEDADSAGVSRMLADAALLVQAYVGVTTNPVVVPRSRSALLEATSDAELLAVGLSERWREEGLGATRSRIASDAMAPVLFVRRGTRPGALAPKDDVTRFTWSSPGTVVADRG